MEQTRRDFIKYYIVVCAVITVVAKICRSESEADGKYETLDETRCPYYDQFLICGGKDKSGSYRCELKN